MSAVRRSVCTLLGAALLLSACRDPEPLTQIVVLVDSDWDGFRTVQIDVDGFVEPVVVDVDVRATKDALPRRLTLVHDGGPLGPLSVTVRATAVNAKGATDVVLIEPRTEVKFTRNETRLLVIDLLFDCIERCAAGLACIAPKEQGGDPRCVSSEDATKLVPYEDDVSTLDPTHHGEVLERPDAGADAAPPETNDAGDANVVIIEDGGTDADVDPPPMDAGKDTGVDSGDKPDVDTGVPPVVTKFAYEPANVDPESDAVTDLDLVDVELDCGTSSFDSSTLKFDDWCSDDEPSVLAIEQDDGVEAALIVMRTLSIDADATLRLRGSRPVILLVFGDARIAGTIDADADAATSGPGAHDDCGDSLGIQGAKTATGAGFPLGAGGGGGGGFGSPGAAGGEGGSGSTTAAGGLVGGDGTLSPLRGGCAGGAGGLGAGGVRFAAGGGGGGAVQIAAAGVLEITGAVSAAGGGGQITVDTHAAGGGGGSGGAILLEGAPVDIDEAAIVSANGGGGGGGQPTTTDSLFSSAGADGRSGSAAASGGNGSNSGADGGDGAVAGSDAIDGDDGETTGVSEGRGGSGGGGGGVGRIRIRGTTTCAPAGELSPPASIECEDCGPCPLPPPNGCTRADYDGAVYYLCAALGWDDARASCQGVGMELIAIDDEDENDWIAGEIGDDSWIGASDATTEGAWRWVATDSLFWSGGTSGGPVDDAFAAWSGTEPTNTDPSFPVSTRVDCAIVDEAGAWADRSCDAQYAYVCE